MQRYYLDHGLSGMVRAPGGEWVSYYSALAAIEKARREEREALTKPLTDDELLSLLREHMNADELLWLTRAVWKDGIDIEKPRLNISKLADAIRARGEGK